jgi:ribosomal protein L31E
MITSAEQFYRLRTSSDRAEYGRAATEKASVDVWNDVIRIYPDMKAWVAHNKAVPMSVLEQLSRDSSLDVRLTVAMKRKLNHRIFGRLARDPEPQVRIAVARNRKAPIDILEALTHDPVQAVALVAKARHHPVESEIEVPADTEINECRVYATVQTDMSH